MKGAILGPAWRFGAFTAVCLVAGFAVVAVFGQLRFDQTRMYHAEFASVTGLEKGNFVRIAGVEVGKVADIRIKDNTTAVVTFSAEDDVALTEGTRAVVRYENLVGGRYLTLEEGAGGSRRLHAGDTIPLDRTAPALDLDALIGGFRPLFRALSPEHVNALTGELVAALQGQGGTIGSFLRNTATLTRTLADRDELIGQVITNLNTVLGSVSEQSKLFDKGVGNLSTLVTTLADHKEDLSRALASSDAAATTIADLLTQARPAIGSLTPQLDRTAGIVVADHDYFTNMLATLPETYQILARQGMYGDFFSFYTCQLVLKVNGKGGQPVYVSVANQTTGRCAPK
ncbi:MULTISPECIES: MCE family protein [Mycobacteriaceae]|uniref:MCE family protein n=1 Tax=Mycobacteriaceae TaxID=1762 RepID=UPI001080EAF9|nr:MCE family protein [Mycobacterium sp. DL99]